MKYAFINGIILDGTENMDEQRGKIILTDGKRIEKIAPDSTDTAGYTTIDLKGQYIMPGLINLHVHLPASGKPKKKQSDPKKLVKLMTSCAPARGVLMKMCESYARTELMSGVTTIRTVGGVENVDSSIRDMVESGRLTGPRILASNMAVSVPEGHMAGSLAYIAENADEARKYVKRIAQDKPDLIKLMITGGVLDARVKGEPGILRMQPEIIRAACDEAHRLGLKVAAHVESPEGVKAALENGVDTIEHGAKPDAEIIRLFKERKAAQVATISPALPYALFDRAVSNTTEMSQFNGQIVFDGIIDCARECLKNGVPVGLGTDTGCPFITHYDMWREVNYFYKYCGVSRRFALYTATLGNAGIAGIADITGSIQEGKAADMIVTEKNPLDDLSALRKPTMIIAEGKLIEKPKLKKMEKVERELDKFI